MIQVHPLPSSSSFLDIQIYPQTCSICCQQKIRGSQQIDKLRLELICYECWASHIKNFIFRISYRAGDDVLSPFNTNSSLDIVNCINSLTFEDAKQVQEALFRKYSAFHKQIQKCPSETCDFVYVGEKCHWGSNNNIYNCPKCQIPLQTSKSTTLKSIMASFYLLMANKCPKCDIPIEKISGCPHMTCPCGHHFCWYCYKDHPSGTLKRLYHLHSNPECAFIFISKIVLFMICATSLLIVFYGNWVLKYLFSILVSIFSVIFRAAILDGAILIQIMFFMMRKRRRMLEKNSTKQKLKIFILMVFINLLGLLLLDLIDEFEFFLMILVGEFVLASIGFSIGYGVFFSIQTWFEFVG